MVKPQFSAYMQVTCMCVNYEKECASFIVRSNICPFKNLSPFPRCPYLFVSDSLIIYLMTLAAFDLYLIKALRKMSVPAARIAIFVVYFWFGLLKVLGPNFSPASPLVQSLFERTIPFMGFGTFFFLFGLFECAIGILFLIPKMERVVIPLLVIHLVTTIMPLFMLPQIAWSGFLVPTLEGQYMLKNILIVAAAIAVAAHLQPMGQKRK
jgi:uncharacterized membrane protein YkgB